MNSQPNQLFFASLLREPIRSVFLLTFFLLPLLPTAAVMFLLLATLPFLMRRIPNFPGVVFLVVLFVALCLYLSLGAGEIRPMPISVVAGLSRAVTAFGLILPLLIVKRENARAAIQYLCVGIVALVFVEGIYTLIVFPDAAVHRLMVYPLATHEEGASTGLINAMALSTAYLLLLSGRRKWGLIALVPLFTVATMYANRTGMILAPAYLLFSFFQASGSSKSNRGWKMKMMAGMVVLSAGVFWWLPPDLREAANTGFTRFNEEGLETDRTDIVITGLKIVLAGEHPLGGAQVDSWSSTLWYHNLFLDAYRVAGIPAMLSFIGLTMISFRTAWASKSKELLFVWSIAFLLAMTSVPIEGFRIEYAIIFSVFSYPFIENRAAPRNSEVS